MSRLKGYIRISDDSKISDPWQLPDYNENKKSPKETALNFDPSWSEPEFDEIDDQEPLDFSMLTADALEEIRQSALEEGLKEGKEAGFKEGKEQGLVEGKEEGLKQGKEEGLQQGLTDGEKIIQDHCQHLESILTKLAFPLKQIDQKVQIKVVEIIKEISRAVINIEVETNPKVILQTLQDVVATMPMSEHSLVIYLHPEDKKIIENAYDRRSIEQYNWKLLAEPHFSRGDIQVACLDSVINFSMKSRIEEALDRFMNKNYIAEIEPDPSQGEDSNILLSEEKVLIVDEEVSAIDEVTTDNNQINQTLDSDIHTEQSQSATVSETSNENTSQKEQTLDNSTDTDPKLDEPKTDGSE